jgi:hypothetical protein
MRFPMDALAAGVPTALNGRSTKIRAANCHCSLTRRAVQDTAAEWAAKPILTAAPAGQPQESGLPTTIQDPTPTAAELALFPAKR